MIEKSKYKEVFIEGKNIDEYEINPCYTEFHKNLFRNAPMLMIKDGNVFSAVFGETREE